MECGGSLPTMKTGRVNRLPVSTLPRRGTLISFKTRHLRRGALIFLGLRLRSEYMAPIPSRLPEEAVSLISAAERRYKHITETEIIELRNCIGPLSVQQALAEDVRGNTIALTQQVEVCLPKMPLYPALVSIRNF